MGCELRVRENGRGKGMGWELRTREKGGDGMGVKGKRKEGWMEVKGKGK